jgi:glutamate-1-semialdehyde aminotransferase
MNSVAKKNKVITFIGGYHGKRRDSGICGKSYAGIEK